MTLVGQMNCEEGNAPPTPQGWPFNVTRFSPKEQMILPLYLNGTLMTCSRNIVCTWSRPSQSPLVFFNNDISTAIFIFMDAVNLDTAGLSSISFLSTESNKLLWISGSITVLIPEEACNDVNFAIGGNTRHIYRVSSYSYQKCWNCGI